MQSILESLVIAMIVAIAIVVVLLIFGVLIGYKEEIERMNGVFYARVIVTPILLVATTYLYIQGQLHSDIFFIAIIWLLPVILCTDWTKLQRKRKSENEPNSSK